MPSAGWYSGPIVKTSRGPHPALDRLRQACAAARPARSRTRASPGRRSGTCRCSRRRGRRPTRRVRPGTEPAEWHRSQSTRAPASCAIRVMAGTSARKPGPVGDVAEHDERGLRADGRGDLLGRDARLGVGLDPAQRAGRAPARCRRARSGRSGSCRCRARSRCARGSAVDGGARQLVQDDRGRVADERLAGCGAERRAADGVADRERQLHPLLVPAADEPAAPALGEEALDALDARAGRPAERVAVEVGDDAARRAVVDAGEAGCGTRRAGRTRRARGAAPSGSGCEVERRRRVSKSVMRRPRRWWGGRRWSGSGPAASARCATVVPRAVVSQAGSAVGSSCSGGAAGAQAKRGPIVGASRSSAASRRWSGARRPGRARASSASSSRSLTPTASGPLPRSVPYRMRPAGAGEPARGCRGRRVNSPVGVPQPWMSSVRDPVMSRRRPSLRCRSSSRRSVNGACASWSAPAAIARAAWPTPCDVDGDGDARRVRLGDDRAESVGCRRSGRPRCSA